MILVIEAIAIYHNIGKSQIRSFQQVHILNHHIVFYDFYHSPHTHEQNVPTGHIETYGLIVSPRSFLTT